jgi:hypothetical protein
MQIVWGRNDDTDPATLDDGAISPAGTESMTTAGKAEIKIESALWHRYRLSNCCSPGIHLCMASRLFKGEVFQIRCSSCLAGNGAAWRYERFIFLLVCRRPVRRELDRPPCAFPRPCSDNRATARKSHFESLCRLRSRYVRNLLQRHLNTLLILRNFHSWFRIRDISPAWIPLIPSRDA